MKKNLVPLVVIVILAAVAGFYFFLYSLSSDSQVVNLALQKGGKTYVFSKLGAQVTQMEISQQKSPSIFPFMQLLVGKELYVTPSDMKELCQLLGGGYSIHEYAEKNFDGYVTADGQELYSLTTENQSTEKVGEQLVKFTVILTNRQGASKRIVWSQKQMSTKQSPIENCEFQSFMIVTNPHPGETVGSSKKFVVVKLQDLVQFFNPNIILEYNQQEQLLYLIED